jgi:hypothetical protein
MLISHSRKFAFVRTRKVGGTSVENYLAQFITDQDIHKYGVGDKAHRPLKSILFDYPECAEYYKLSIERNPWDKFISYYYWMPKRKNHWRAKECYGMSMDEYVDYCLKNNFISDFDKYTKNGKISVDKVMRYENLLGDLKEVCEKLKLPFDEEEWVNNSKFNEKRKFRKDKRHYSEILTNEQAEKIAKIFHREIKMFGYTF